MNGLITQWKRVDNTNGDKVVTLPISFSNNNYMLFSQVQGKTSYANAFAGGDWNRQSDYKTFYSGESYNSYNGYVQFFAIGY